MNGNKVGLCYSSCAKGVLSLAGSEVWGGGLPSPDYHNEVFLSPPNTAFLLPVLLIDDTIIITNCYTSASKLCLILHTYIHTFNLLKETLKQ